MDIINILFIVALIYFFSSLQKRKNKGIIVLKNHHRRLMDRSRFRKTLRYKSRMDMITSSFEKTAPCLEAS